MLYFLGLNSVDSVVLKVSLASYMKLIAKPDKKIKTEIPKRGSKIMLLFALWEIASGLPLGSGRD